MYKLGRSPINVYKSTDDGAPQLTVANGEIKTLLKAVLCTGYGDKAGEGWNLVYEDLDNNPNEILLQPKNTLTNNVMLYLNDELINYSSYCKYINYKVIAATDNISSFDDVGDNVFTLRTDVVNNGLLSIEQIPIFNGYYSSSSTITWLMLACDTFFCLCISSSQTDNLCSKPIFFGALYAEEEGQDAVNIFAFNQSRYMLEYCAQGVIGTLNFTSNTSFNYCAAFASHGHRVNNDRDSQGYYSAPLYKTISPTPPTLYGRTTLTKTTDPIGIYYLPIFGQPDVNYMPSERFEEFTTGKFLGVSGLSTRSSYVPNMNNSFGDLYMMDTEF